MGDFRKMMPFIFHFAAGVYGKEGSDLSLPVEEQFRIARKTGWSEDPDDPGGATMIDVTIGTYRAYRMRKDGHVATKNDLQGISFEEWCEILETCFWDRWRASEIESQGIANLLVDWVWAGGPKTIRTVQRVLKVKADGIVGPRTLAAINDSDAGSLFEVLFSARERHYRSCRGAWKYLSGWLRRLRAIRPDGTFLINGRIIPGQRTQPEGE